MHYEIRGLIEENLDYLLTQTAKEVAANKHFWNLPAELRAAIAVEAAFNRVMGFHQMWCFIDGNTPEEGHRKDIQTIVNKRSEGLAYVVEEKVAEYKEQAEQKTESPNYDV